MRDRPNYWVTSLLYLFCYAVTSPAVLRRLYIYVCISKNVSELRHRLQKHVADMKLTKMSVLPQCPESPSNALTVKRISSRKQSNRFRNIRQPTPPCLSGRLVRDRHLARSFRTTRGPFQNGYPRKLNKNGCGRVLTVKASLPKAN